MLITHISSKSLDHFRGNPILGHLHTYMYIYIIIYIHIIIYYMLYIIVYMMCYMLYVWYYISYVICYIFYIIYYISYIIYYIFYILYYIWYYILYYIYMIEIYNISVYIYTSGIIFVEPQVCPPIRTSWPPCDGQSTRAWSSGIPGFLQRISATSWRVAAKQRGDSPKIFWSWK